MISYFLQIYPTSQKYKNDGYYPIGKLQHRTWALLATDFIANQTAMLYYKHYCFSTLFYQKC